MLKLSCPSLRSPCLIIFFRHCAVPYGYHIYIFGGATCTNKALGHMYKFNTRTKTWTMINTPMPYEGFDLACSKIYLQGWPYISSGTLYFVDCESADGSREKLLCQNERYISKLQNGTNIALLLWILFVIHFNKSFLVSFLSHFAGPQFS